ncbi:MAG: tRNA (cytidine(34)-2'-O)-methyltransferase [Pseudomonadota bacterium]|jgi:tRNA (cytidine/uridine-2'-O-)-methyltransferase|nr:tRNA (cytidine(34)-2'-O)-methyltransferase [Pseudomonadota bacterium]MEC8717074.1 tRNA (cytidine(34)-2'-O)-methyltransferase [Pseudomonadota bacterium]
MRPPAVILYEPEIPPNTGNVIRLCAVTGAPLHLIAPLGFELDDRRLRRAGLDYHEFASLAVHNSLASCLEQFSPGSVYAFTTKGAHSAFDAPLGAASALLFGPETRGLPDVVLARFPEAQRLRLPQLPGRRSLNLSNAVAVAVFEAWRQQGFPSP